MNVSANEHGGGVHTARRALVVGYGNSLRGDDGAGPAVAERLAQERIPGARILTSMQLTPDLAEDLGRADLAVFIDAAPAATTPSVRVEAVQAATDLPAVSAVGHSGDPRALLALARRLYGRAPEAWLVSVPAHRMDIGEGLSQATARAVDEAVHAVVQVLREVAHA
jgi:hydrogenase maturation protease